MRNLTEGEARLVEKLLDRDVAGAAQLRGQLSDCTVYPMNNDETILRFCLPPHAVPADVPYIQDVAVEAVAIDADGCRVEVLLHVKDGKLFELEYLKTDGTPLRSSIHSRLSVGTLRAESFPRRLSKRPASLSSS